MVTRACIQKWAAKWKNNKMTRVPNEDSDQPGHPPSLIRVVTVYLKKPRVLNYPLIAQQRHWSDWADAQADLSLRWAHRSSCWFCHAAAQMCMQLSMATLARAQQHQQTNMCIWGRLGLCMTKPTKWCAPSEVSDQPGYLPSLIRVFIVQFMGSQGPNVSSCGEQKFAGRTVNFVGFVLWRLNSDQPVHQCCLFNCLFAWWRFRSLASHGASCIH